MSVVITTYTLASGLMQQGMTWWQAMHHHPARQRHRARADGAERARRHEIRRVVPGAVPRQRSACKGANVPAMLRAIVACGWFGIQTWIGGLALHALMAAAWSGWAAGAGRDLDRVRGVLADPGRDHRARAGGHQAAGELVGAAAARRRRGAARLGDLSRRRARPHPLGVGAPAAGTDAVLAALSRPASPRTSATGRRSASTSRTSPATRAASARRCSARRWACRRR